MLWNNPENKGTGLQFRKDKSLHYVSSSNQSFRVCLGTHGWAGGGRSKPIYLGVCDGVIAVPSRDTTPLSSRIHYCH